MEGQNLILERRSAEGRFERFGDIVAELVRLNVDVIVTASDPMTRAAKAVTMTVPIVMAFSIDPVGQGIVQSLARPGGNVTGLMTFVGPEIEAKRLELLREMLPGVSRVAYLANKEEKDWERPYGKTADLPVEQPTLFELIINLRTAKTLTIPPSLLQRADRVIE